jgi:short-subunit dehydrogenase
MRVCTSLGVVFLAISTVPFYYEWMPPEVSGVKGKCALVTGVSAGLGITIASRLASEGVSKLIVTARSFEKLQRVADNLTRHFPDTEIIPVASDVSKDEDNAALVEVALEAFGHSCPILLVNNAGVCGAFDFATMARHEIDNILNIDLRGLMHLSRDFLPAMIRSGGHIVNIGSMASKVPFPRLTVYNAAKHGMMGFTAGLRTEMRIGSHPVTVHAVLPGFVLEAGMAVDNAAAAGNSLDLLTAVAGYSYPADTAAAVINAVKYDIPEILVNFPPPRLALVAGALFTRTFDWLFSAVPRERLLVF